ncbi:rhamnosyl transferase [Pontibacter sp. BAB1700]|nr:rhamnosyl transferase [Pontibacter sp. BAB1700]
MLSGININKYLYAAVLLSIVVAFFISRIKKAVIYAILVYTVFLILSGLNGVLNELAFQAILSQFGYYFKPILFFLFGYFFIRKSDYNSVIQFIFYFMVAGSLIFFTSPDFFIEQAILKSPEGQGYEHFYSFGGTALRNSTLLLSPLDSGYIFMFLSLHFLSIYIQEKEYKWHLLACIVLAISTITRSAILGLIAGSIFYFWISLDFNRRFVFIIVLSFLAAILGTIYYQKIYYILIKDGSASIHIENLVDSLKALASRPWGYGLGYSGWAGISHNDKALYSEGFFFMTLIEHGVLFLLFYLFIFVVLFNYSKKYLLPIYIGFIVASLMIPIGLSTVFNCAFFTYFGLLLRTHNAHYSQNTAILIINWNNAADTIECLTSLAEHNYHKTQKTVIIDNDSADNSLAEITEFITATYGMPVTLNCTGIEEINTRDLQAHEQNFFIIKSRKNLGFAGANNLGILLAQKLAGIEYVWLLNNDTAIEKNALEYLIDDARANPSAGFVGSVLVDYYDRSLVQCCGAVLHPALGVTKLYFKNKPVETLNQVEPAKIDYQSGASLLVKMSAIEQIGMMEPDFFMYFEESDWQIRGRKQGIQNMLSLKSIIYHKGSVSTSNRKHFFYYFYNRASMLFVQRNYVLLLLPALLSLSFITIIKNIRAVQNIKYGFKGIVHGIIKKSIV